jgi:hypothetical protein
MLKTVEVYVHGSRESNLNKGREIGLSGEALLMFAYATEEIKLTLEVNTDTGMAKTVAVDGVKPIDAYPIFDILERLYDSGHYTTKQDGRWILFDKGGEGVMSGETFRGLCVNIILAWSLNLGFARSGGHVG